MLFLFFLVFIFTDACGSEFNGYFGIPSAKIYTDDVGKCLILQSVRSKRE